MKVRMRFGTSRSFKRGLTLVASHNGVSLTVALRGGQATDTEFLQQGATVKKARYCVSLQQVNRDSLVVNLRDMKRREGSKRSRSDARSARERTRAAERNLVCPGE